MDASLSVPTVARQPLLARVLASASLLEADCQILDVGDLDAVDSENGFETKFDFWHCG